MTCFLASDATEDLMLIEKRSRHDVAIVEVRNRNSIEGLLTLDDGNLGRS